jgi:hypothetical protein
MISIKDFERVIKINQEEFETFKNHSCFPQFALTQPFIVQAIFNFV